MSELTLLVLRIGFLILMWAFVFSIVYALRSDLFGTKVRRLPTTGGASGGADPASAFAAPAAPSAAPTSPVAAPDPTAPARRLVITSGAKEGLELPLDGDQLTVGRSADSGLIIRDDYTSTNHARLTLVDGVWTIDDLGSTNGTFVKGRKISRPTPLALNTPVSIGTTTFELRR